MTLPLPWTLASFWALFQTAVQLSFVVMIMILVLGFLAFLVTIFIEDLN